MNTYKPFYDCDIKNIKLIISVKIIYTLYKKYYWHKEIHDIILLNPNVVNSNMIYMQTNVMSFLLYEDPLDYMKTP